VQSKYLVARIRSEMDAAGLIQRDVCELGQISIPTMSRFMTGQVQSPRTAAKIAAALGHEHIPETWVRKQRKAAA
jgi:transcriptional regulator with XRE-family HTH domain